MLVTQGTFSALGLAERLAGWPLPGPAERLAGKRLPLVTRSRAVLGLACQPACHRSRCPAPWPARNAARKPAGLPGADPAGLD
jgi:hypothetical protein